MDKRTKKNTKYTYDPSLIKALVEKYGYTPSYIRKCLNLNSNSITADTIKADYKELEKNLKDILLNFNNKA
jgi:hypothetical protein